MLREEKDTEAVMAIGYTDGEKIYNIPPKDMKNRDVRSEDVRIDIVTKRVLDRTHEDEVIIFCDEVGTLSPKATKQVDEILGKGIGGDIPIGLIDSWSNKTEKIDEGR